MPSKNRLTLLVLAILLVGAGLLVFLINTGSSPAPIDAGPGGEPVARTEGEPVVPAPDTGASRVVTPRQGTDSPEWMPDDPEWRRSLGGVRGRLLESDSRPAAGIEVAAVGDWLPAVINLYKRLQDGSDQSLNPVLDRVFTDAEGRFELKGLYPGETAVMRFSEKRQTLLSMPLPQVPGPGEVVDLGDILLPGFTTLSGRLVDKETGAPVAGAEVFLSSLPGVAAQSCFLDLKGGEWLMGRLGGPSSPMKMIKVPRAISSLRRLLAFPSAVTDKDGNYTIERVTAGLLSLIASKPGYRSVRKLAIRTHAGKDRVMGPLSMSRRDHLAVTVKEEDGRPVVGATVLAGVMPGMMPVAIMHAVGETDREGQVSVTGLDNGLVHLAVSRPGGPWTFVGPIRGETCQVVLDKGHGLRIRLVDGDGGSEATVKPDRAVLTGVFAGHPLDANIQVTSQGLIELRGLPRGSYFLRLEMKGYMDLIQSVELPDPSVESGGERRVKVTRGHQAKLLVKDMSGRPVKGVRVMVMSMFDQNPFRRDQQLNPDIRQQYTGADGLVELGPLLPGRKQVSIWHPRLGSTMVRVKVPQEETQEVVLACGRIEGIIEPVVAGPDGRPWQVWLFCDNSPVLVKSTRVAKDGTFAFDGLGHRSMEMMLVPGRTLVPAELYFFNMVSSGSRPEARKRVRVKPGETTKVTLKLRSYRTDRGAIEGVVCKDGRPAEGIMVQAGGWRGPRVMTAKDGSYLLRGVETGRIRVKVGVQDPGFEGRLRQITGATVELGKGDRRRQDFHIWSGSIQGVVQDTLGGSLGIVMVRATPTMQKSGGPESIECLTDTRGAYRMEMVAPGEWTLSVRGETCQPGKPVKVVMVEGAKVQAPVLEAIRSVSVTIRFDPPTPKGHNLQFLRMTPIGGEVKKPIDKYVHGESRSYSCFLPPGTYRIKVYEGKGRYWSNNSRTVREGELQVPPEGAKDLVLHLGAAVDPVVKVPYAGVVMDKDGKAVTNTQLRLYAMSRKDDDSPFGGFRSYRTDVGGEGHFSIDLPPGTYHASVRVKEAGKSGRKYLSGRVDVPQSGASGVELKLK